MTPVQDILAFFVENTPGPEALALGGPVALAWASACLALAAYLKKRRRWRTGYTRKTFHFLIFASVTAVHAFWGTPGVCLFGAMTSLVVAFAVWRGAGHPWYEAMAREKDAPRRTYYVIAPYLATLMGGLVSNVFLARYALFGYLVTGLGDAIAEPVGTRFGKHPYRVPSFGGVVARRTLEGSASVLLVSFLALMACGVFSTLYELSATSVAVVAGIAVASTVIEAVSPHGWDNATMQIVPALLGCLLLPR